MKLSDFDIGTEFKTSTWHRWRCTDVGRRTILAIELDPDLDEAWLAGPPYVVQEVVFDEIEMERAFRSTDEAISQSMKALDDEAHPGIPADAARLMLRAELESASRKYPRRRLLLIDRVDTSGEILHPYAAEEGADGWIILVYLPFSRTFSALPERDFVRLRAATEEDLKERRGRLTASGSES
ncbi:hypothetical protein [Solilutibacter silvestris]|uniref:Uncharacterized protein n=1 Tax=Solilutibacter silvestris TaxID=1645665 RepID=A0A2K1Q3Z7_9GAMM|nr:hypothetical protein [Lysobacter silvestris]PNS09765.1 hypothetical protein Lysil_1394 [Lysobacter silvestris]